MGSNEDVALLLVAAIEPISHEVDCGQCEFWQVEGRHAVAGEVVVGDIATPNRTGAYDTTSPADGSCAAALSDSL